MSDFDVRMAQLQGRFVARAAEAAAAVEQYLAEQAWPELRSLCHGLAGRAGMFGYSDLGALALRLEETIENQGGAEAIGVLGGQLVGELKGIRQER